MFYKKSYSAFLLVLAMSFPGFTPSSHGQSCTFNWSVHYEKLVRLTNDPTPTGDSVTVPIFESLSGSSNNLRETWYIPAASEVDRGPFYRFEEQGGGGHLDDPSPTVPGFNQDLLLGHPWTSRARDGLSPLRRYINPSTLDYRTWLFSSNPSGYTDNATWWISNPTPRFGYERFGNKLDYLSARATGYGAHTLENFFLKVELNSVWGQAIGRITHKPSGRQFVRENIGDMVQSTIRFDPGDPDCSLANPTQSGGTYLGNYGETRLWAGSPVISTTKNTTTEPYTVTSTIRPLEFYHSTPSPTTWPDTQPENPLAWRGHFERTEVLGCRLGSLLRRDVLDSSTRYRLASHHPSNSLQAAQVQTHWLDLTAFGDPRLEEIELHWVDLDTGTKTPIQYFNNGSVVWNNDWIKDNVGHRLAVQVATKDQSFSVAIARLDSPHVFNDRTVVQLRCTDPNNTPCDPAQTQLIVQVVLRATQITKSYSAPLRSFMLVNSVQFVDQRLAELVSDGGSCLN